MLRLAVLAPLLLGGTLALCSAPRPSLPDHALRVPLVRQATSYSCGPAALLAVLYYWTAYDDTESSLYAALDTTERDGTEPDALARVAAAHGLRARYRTGVTIAELRAAVAGGQTVILDLQAWGDGRRPWADDWDDGHYVVLVAVDAHFAYAMDPAAPAGYDYLPIGELPARWHDLDRQGHKLEHPAVFITGRTHLSDYPAPLSEMR